MREETGTALYPTDNVYIQLQRTVNYTSSKMELFLD